MAYLCRLKVINISYRITADARVYLHKSLVHGFRIVINIQIMPTEFDVDDPNYRITPTQQMFSSCAGALFTSIFGILNFIQENNRQVLVYETII